MAESSTPGKIRAFRAFSTFYGETDGDVVESCSAAANARGIDGATQRGTPVAVAQSPLPIPLVGIG